MTNTLSTRLDRLLRELPHRYPGPGGAIAVLREGEVLARHAWGYANAERRLPFTPRSLFRMCSITKQFTCGTMLRAVAAPEALDGAIRARLPLLGDSTPGARHLAHNQSGLRDYWAVAMLHGAPAESAFGDVEAARVIAETSSLQFTPGTRYSYCNQNFRLISDALQDVTGRDFAELLRSHIFTPVGMESAILAAETAAMPDGSEGYEGTQASGFRAAVNRVFWTGDAGLGASLDDMIAWERHIDATRADAESLHARLSVPVTFTDGAAAPYGFGLGRAEAFGTPVLGHGGALRGWRSHRFYVPAHRISVVVLFNHLSDASAAAMEALAAVLDQETPRPDPALPPPDWLGSYQEPETGLSVRIDSAGPGSLRLSFGQRPERLNLRADGTAGGALVRLRPTAEGLWMDRRQDNLSSLLRPCPGPAPTDIAGRYRCAEIGAELLVTDEGGVAYGGFSGHLGQGRMELLEPAGRDLWTLPCWRALDHSPPGDWTLAFRRDGVGRVNGLTFGCWLARGLDYARVADR